MLILYETPAGYAIFQITSSKALKNIENIHTYFEDEEKAQGL
jgi:hypothetical protein